MTNDPRAKGKGIWTVDHVYNYERRPTKAAKAKGG